MIIRLALKNLISKRRRTFTALAGISISMALFISTMLILKSAQSSFAKPLEDTGADIIVQLQGEPCVWSIVKLPQNLNPIPIETIDRLKSLDSVASVGGSLIVWAFSNPPSASPGAQTSPGPQGINSQQILADISSGKVQGEPCDYGPPGSFCGGEGGRGPSAISDFSPIVVAGIDTELKNIGPITAHNLKDIEGEFFSKDDTYATILDKDFARMRRLKVGDGIDLGQKFFKIKGIIDSGRDAKIAGAQVFIPLKTAIEMAGRGNVVDIVFIKLKPNIDPDTAKKDLQKAVPENATVTSSTDFFKAIAGLSNLTQSLMLAIFFIATAIAILFIIKTVFGAMAERSSELGILKAIGWTDKNIIKLISIEHMIVGFLGGIIGSLLGYLGSLAYKANLPSILPYYLNPYPPCSQHLVKNVLNISVHLSPPILVYAILGAVLIQSLTSFFAVQKILKLMPAEAIRRI